LEHAAVAAGSRLRCGKYFGIMWKNRRRFVPVYFKNHFYPFIQTTARCEGTNVVFEANVGSSYSVIAFMT
jgi:hypothetical protein